MSSMKYAKMNESNAVSFVWLRSAYIGSLKDLKFCWFSSFETSPLIFPRMFFFRIDLFFTAIDKCFHPNEDANATRAVPMTT